MAIFSKCYIMLLLGTAVTLAAEPVSVELVHFSAAKPLPKGLAEDSFALQNVKPGCKLTFLVQGTNLTRLKPETCKLQVLKTKAGKDVRTINGQPSYLEPSRFDDKTYDGRYGIFTLELDASLFPELNQLELQGTLDVQFAEGTDKLESQPLEYAKKQELKLGDFQVKLLGEKEVKPFNFGQRTDKEKEMKQKNLALNLRGPEEKIASIRVLRKETVLEVVSTLRGGNMIEYEFRLDEENINQPIKIELTTWKNLRTVTVPFQLNATIK